MSGGVREILDVPGSSAPVIKLGEGDLVVVGDTGLRFLAPGQYIILPIERWAATLAKAVAAQEGPDPQTPESSRRIRRAQRRELMRDRVN